MQDTTKLFKLFKQYAYALNYSTAFNDILDYFLIPFKIYENKVKREQAFDRLINHDKKDMMIAVLTEIGELSEGFNDPLGHLYERLISKGQHAQFFTPEHVTDFMAASVIHDGMKTGQTVCDPCCGSGRMLLSAAKINRHLQFYGADIDLACAKMTLVNMILNSLSGEIAHMDSLSNDFYQGYKTGTILKEGYHYPYYTEFTDKEESYIWQCIRLSDQKAPFDMPFNPKSSGPVNGVQGSLF